MAKSVSSIFHGYWWNHQKVMQIQGWKRYTETVGLFSKKNHLCSHALHQEIPKEHPPDTWRKKMKKEVIRISPTWLQQWEWPQGRHIVGWLDGNSFLRKPLPLAVIVHLLLKYASDLFWQGQCLLLNTCVKPHSNHDTHTHRYICICICICILYIYIYIYMYINIYIYILLIICVYGKPKTQKNPVILGTCRNDHFFLVKYCFYPLWPEKWSIKITLQSYRSKTVLFQHVVEKRAM